ncbi:hypothetical protein IEO21_06603 [Rhodonia placenta]|uniref:Uncharacterized protein n=1 Tax=Rhodonia placenta TaxID=104341 RepID=A0A8H7NZX4_9APHY|nr:hypothetical protein IEO21_06603 [Postia placenta]
MPRDYSVCTSVPQATRRSLFQLITETLCGGLPEGAGGDEKSGLPVGDALPCSGDMHSLLKAYTRPNSEPMLSEVVLHVSLCGDFHSCEQVYGTIPIPRQVSCSAGWEGGSSRLENKESALWEYMCTSMAKIIRLLDCCGTHAYLRLILQRREEMTP